MDNWLSIQLCGAGLEFIYSTKLDSTKKFLFRNEGNIFQFIRYFSCGDIRIDTYLDHTDAKEIFYLYNLTARFRREIPCRQCLNLIHAQLL